jgi:hypothetical protein
VHGRRAANEGKNRTPKHQVGTRESGDAARVELLERDQEFDSMRGR